MQNEQDLVGMNLHKAKNVLHQLEVTYRVIESHNEKFMLEFMENADRINLFVDNITSYSGHGSYNQYSSTPPPRPPEDVKVLKVTRG